MVQIIAGGGLQLPIVGNGATVTVSTPLLDLSQTWNAGGVPFTGLKLNITDTASASASLFLDFQVAGASKASVRKSGEIVSTADFWAQSNLLSAGYYWGTSADVFLGRDAANILAQRNLTNPQAFRVYNTFTDASNGEWADSSWSSNIWVFGTNKNGTGSQRAVALEVGGTQYWQWVAGGHMLASTDNVTDIGQSAANRPRDIWIGRDFTGRNATLTGTTGLTSASTTLLTTSVALTNGAAAQVGTLTNAPTAGNPTKWVPINDNGVTRYLPAW